MKSKNKMSFRRRHNKKNNSVILASFYKSIDWSKVIISIITISVVTFVSAYYYLPNSVSWKTGDIADKTIVSKSSVTYRDYYSEKLLKNQVNVKDVIYDIVPEAKANTISDINLIFNAIAAERKNTSLETEIKIKNLRVDIIRYSRGKLDDKSIYTFLSISDDEFHSVKETALVIAASILSDDVKEDIYYMRQTQDKIKKETADVFVNNPELADICYRVLIDTIRPNRIYSQEKTDAFRSQKQAEVKPIYKAIRNGDIVIRQGEKVTIGTKEALDALGINNGKGRIWQVLNVFLYVVFAFALIAIYIKSFSKIADFKSLLLLNLIVVANFLLFLASGTMVEGAFDITKTTYLGSMWIVSIAMLIFVFSGRQLAWLILMLLSILLAYVLGNDTRCAAISIVTGIGAIYAVSRIRSRSDIINVCLVIGVLTFIQVFIYGLLYNDSLKVIFNDHIKWAVLILPISTFVFMVMSSILEKLFDITTPMRLVELSDTNLPLLRRLALEAPGTYAHAISVAHIGESAADLIGADSLMVRIGAYYHDIGKLSQPQYFSENQYSVNVHDELNPTLSSMVVQSHVKNGVEIAKEYKLPGSIVNLIMQHHGTTLVTYFYNQFAASYENALEIEEQFRYPGPKPKTKEAAILMMADSVEAASRSINQPTTAKIESLVGKIVSSKLGDGQFSECPLTLRDISLIKMSFTKTLMYVLHSRIRYPEKEVINGNNLGEVKDSKESEENKEASDRDTEKE